MRLPRTPSFWFFSVYLFWVCLLAFHLAEGGLATAASRKRPMDAQGERQVHPKKAALAAKRLFKNCSPTGETSAVGQYATGDEDNEQGGKGNDGGHSHDYAGPSSKDGPPPPHTGRSKSRKRKRKQSSREGDGGGGDGGTGAAFEMRMPPWRQFEVYCNEKISTVLTDWDSARKFIEEEYARIQLNRMLRGFQEVHDTMKCSEEVLVEVGLLRSGAKNRVKQYYEQHGKKTPRGYGADAIAVKRNANGEIIDIVLIEYKYRRQWKGTTLETQRHARKLVMKKLKLDHLPWILLAVPKHYIHLTSAEVRSTKRTYNTSTTTTIDSFSLRLMAL